MQANLRRTMGTLALALLAGGAAAQGADTVALQSAQREAIGRLAAMNGLWRGTAWTMLPTGEKRQITQTERIGNFLEGTVKVIEGRGYNERADLLFNAFGVVSFDPGKQAYSIRSHALGRAGDFAFRPTAEGYEWEVPAGPGAVIRYSAKIKDNRLVERGDRIVQGQPPLQVFEMSLERLGDSDWPAAGALGPK